MIKGIDEKEIMKEMRNVKSLGKFIYSDSVSRGPLAIHIISYFLFSDDKDVIKKENLDNLKSFLLEKYEQDIEAIERATKRTIDKNFGEDLEKDVKDIINKYMEPTH